MLYQSYEVKAFFLKGLLHLQLKTNRRFENEVLLNIRFSYRPVWHILAWLCGSDKFWNGYQRVILSQGLPGTSKRCDFPKEVLELCHLYSMHKVDGPAILPFWLGWASSEAPHCERTKANVRPAKDRTIPIYFSIPLKLRTTNKFPKQSRAIGGEFWKPTILG